MTHKPQKLSVGTLLSRALRLRCPACGQTKMFRSWFRMNDPCSNCGRKFDRSPGFFLGSIYVNYGVTAWLAVAAYFGCFFSGVLTGTPLLIVVTVVIVAFPIWFFRYARALWVAFDEKWDPWPNDQEARSIKTSEFETQPLETHPTAE